MSAAVDLRVFDRAAEIGTILEPLVQEPFSPPAITSLHRGVELIEQHAREMREQQSERQAAIRAACNRVEWAALNDLSATIESYRAGVRALRATLVEKASEVRPNMPASLDALLERLVAAQASTLETLSQLYDFLTQSMAELGKAAENDPVLASLLNAPADDEPFTEEDDRALDDALRSGFVRHEDRGNVQ